jgi:hypothetical protein
MHSSDQVNSNLTLQVEANCMKSNWKQTCIQVIKFDLNLAWQVEANCMPFIAWNRIESKHASGQVQFQTNQANWS